ncbi:MAG TPA: indole-3-glycerol phosphate synthase TrpC [Candidatus Dormibacteraeota bacterium]|nr:indole-3-glycerol phosphate synthase TrpC [Candidatus Dormibacteraeota bacterium]
MAIETTGTILDKIVAARRVTVEHRKRVLPLVALRMAVEKGKPLPVRDFAAALGRPGVSVIAEVKKASPSRGLLRADYVPDWLAQRLDLSGASAISVLTEEEFFQGALEHLRLVRPVTSVPLLRKDFVFDPWQVWESRAAGADSFLLIAAILDEALLAELISLGRTLGMEPLVEVHTRAELDRALAAGAMIVGVNNRDLRDFSVRLETSIELIEAIPEDRIAVTESGLRSSVEIARLAEAGFDAFLVGEQLMVAEDPGAALRALLGREAN